MPNQGEDELILRMRLWADVHSRDPEIFALKVLRDAENYGADPAFNATGDRMSG